MAVKIQGVARTSELFREKLRYALRQRGETQAAVAREVGVTPQAFQGYLTGSAPTPEQLATIGRVLEIDLEWLCDDSDTRLDLDKPSDELTLQNATRSELMDELARRMRLEMVELRRLLQWAEAQDWRFEYAAIQMLASNTTAMKDPVVRKLAEVATRIMTLEMSLEEYDLAQYAEDNHYHLPGSPAFSAGDLTQEAIQRSCEELNKKHPGIDALQWFVMTFAPIYGEGQAKRTDSERGFVRMEQLRLLRGLLDHPTMKDREELARLREWVVNAQKEAEAAVKDNAADRDQQLRELPSWWDQAMQRLDDGGEDSKE